MFGKSKKFTKVETFEKRPIYLHLLIKYNSVCNKYNALVDTVESDLYKKIIDEACSNAITIENYKDENIKLKRENRELKKLLSKK